MTRLIDLHAPQHDISESLVLHVKAAPEDVIRVVGHGERVFRSTWHPTPGAPGSVDVVWDIRVEPDEDGGSYLSSTRRFIAGDDAARDELLSSWRHVRTTADTIARRTLRTIKRAAEESLTVAAVPPHVELLAA